MQLTLENNPLATIGRVFLNFLAAIGRFSIFASVAVSNVFRPKFYFRNILAQMIEIGFYSLPVVGLTAIFTGAVLALQSYTGFSRFNAESSIPLVVVLSITRELGPVLAGLMVAGRVGASMAAEIGTMRVTEQIDALTTLSTNPVRYLIVPRIIAAVLMLPCLVAIGDVIGVYGGYLVSVHKLGFNAGVYMKNTVENLHWDDVNCSLAKAAVFGFVISIMGCYNGFHSKGGAQGVGMATTNAVVTSSIMILLSNYILTELFFSR